MGRDETFRSSYGVGLLGKFMENLGQNKKFCALFKLGIFCEILGSHDGEYESGCLLGCCAL
jgi:hypothetical protein